MMGSAFCDHSDFYPLLLNTISKNTNTDGRFGGTEVTYLVVDREECESFIENGKYAGETLHNLIRHFQRQVIGAESLDGRFPIVVKIINTTVRTPLTVHPDAQICQTRQDGGTPKNEMWYILNAQPGAEVFAGISRMSSQHQFIDALENGNVEATLQTYPSLPGDAYFIRARRIHSIGSGNTLLSVHQNSDTEYPLTNWIPDHKYTSDLQEALSCIDFTDRTSCRISAISDTQMRNRKVPVITQCPFFPTDELKLTDTWNDNTANTYHILFPVNAAVKAGRGNSKTEIPAGRACLIPACYGEYEIEVTGPVSVLRITG